MKKRYNKSFPSCFYHVINEAFLCIVSIALKSVWNHFVCSRSKLRMKTEVWQSAKIISFHFRINNSLPAMLCSQGNIFLSNLYISIRRTIWKIFESTVIQINKILIIKFLILGVHRKIFTRLISLHVLHNLVLVYLSLNLIVFKFYMCI